MQYAINGFKRKIDHRSYKTDKNDLLIKFKNGGGLFVL